MLTFSATSRMLHSHPNHLDFSSITPHSSQVIHVTDKYKHKDPPVICCVSPWCLAQSPLRHGGVFREDSGGEVLNAPSALL